MQDPRQSPAAQSTAALTLLALGVVYGDIGTSPLYAAKETFNPDHGLPLTPENILGGVSAIFWALMIVVSLKYVMLVLRADNHGEGGIMALLALAGESVRGRPRTSAALMMTGVAGGALFYGDAVLTPAISVLSAVEGLEVGTATLKPFVVPIAVGVLLALFAIQRHGTARVGAYFGPVCALWFLALGAVGVWNIGKAPQILAALDPAHALRFVTGHGYASFLALGAVLLAITGAEALYADLGHFGRRAIRWAWFGAAAPALVLNYFGQGALLLTRPEAVANPFYLAFPPWALYPMVVLATLATIIASQATISGAYSITLQAMQLGFLPRIEVRHTSAQTIGQVYVPLVNAVLLIAVLAAVLGFASSERLASAYGVAVMGTMLVTTTLAFFVFRFRWRYPLLLCLSVSAAFLLLDVAFLSAALHKVLDGGWFPLVLGAVMMTLMLTWRRGRLLLLERLRTGSPPLPQFCAALLMSPPDRIAGTAVYLTSTPDVTPHALLHSLKHFQVLHAQVVFLTVNFSRQPWTAPADRIHCEHLAPDVWRVRLTCGFMERPDVSRALELCGPFGLQLDPARVTYFLSREKLVPLTQPAGRGRWREQLFAALARNAGSVTDFFNIPTNRVVELGTRVEL